MSVNSKMTAIADEIRELSGITDPMGLDAMATNVNEANAEVVSQAEQIAEIMELLEGKSVEGSSNEDVTDETNTYTDLLTDLEAAVDALPDAGSGDGTSVETCSIRLVCTTESIYGYFYLAYRDEQFVPVYFANGSTQSTIDVTLSDVVCGGGIYVQTNITATMGEISITGDATAEFPSRHMISSGTATVLVYAPNTTGSTSTVTIIDND